MAVRRKVRHPRSALLRGVLLAMVMVAAARPGSAAVQRATPGDPARTQSMQVVLVRDPRPDCGASCAEWIAAQGKIDANTPRRFDRVLARLGTRKVPVFIDSLGGSVKDAETVGRSIKGRQLDVVVTRTAFDPCPAGDAACQPSRADGSRPGHPRGAGSVCASACVLVLAAGEKREAAFTTVVGVHQIIQSAVLTRTRRLFKIFTREVDGRRVEVSRTLVSVTPVSRANILIKPPPRVYADVAAYLARMGIGPSLMSMMLATPHESIHWLTPGEEAVTGIVTAHIDGESVVDGAYAASRSGGPQRQAGVEPTVTPAQATWTFDDRNQSPAYVERPSLRADLTFPESGLQLALRVEQEPITAGLQFYHLVLNVVTPNSGLFQVVSEARLTCTADPAAAGGDLPIGTLSRTAADAFEFTLGSDDLGRLFPPAVEAAPNFRLRLTMADGRVAILSFSSPQGTGAAIATAMKRWAAQPRPGLAASGS